MAGQIFMRVDEVASELGVSVPYDYKRIRKMNEELAKTSCITISGRIRAVDKPYTLSFYHGKIEEKRGGFTYDDADRQ